MPDMPPPVLLSVVAGEGLHRSLGTGRFSLLNILLGVGVEALPLTLPTLGVYVAVTEVVRDTHINVQLVTPGGDELAVGLGWNLKGGDPLVIHEMGTEFVGVTFRAPGDYALRVLADGDMLNEWRIRVTQFGGKP